MNLASADRNRLLEASWRIGERIVEEAFWHEDRCNWVGAEPIERQPNGRRRTAIYRTLGSDLYSGTSGIALFLAELFRVTDEDQFRATALGAIRQAFTCCAPTAPISRIGLFNGWIGIALTAVRLANILDDQKLQKKALDLLREALKEPLDRCEVDIISGRAGAISSLVILYAITNRSFLLDSAIRLGHELVEAADECDAGMSWKLTGVASHHNLTGYSHGAAGAACSLLELYSITGVKSFELAALNAFRYERKWFNASEENWPDFRADLSARSRKLTRFSCLCYWCHGASGIALSRMRAYEILKDEVNRAEAIAALNTTRKSILAANSRGTGNYSLCHGVCGNAEALLYGSEIFEESRAQDLSINHTAAVSGIERYMQCSWPCGTHEGETPNLMLGLAGIGHHFLRLHDPTVPAILILRKHEWVSH